MDDKLHILDVVELTAASGRWPAGTVGTVVEMHDRTLLVEIEDDRGHALDYVDIPFEAVQPLESPYTQPRLAP